jgi:segregation and condensation protein A
MDTQEQIVNPFLVRTERYEGPLELILDLIEKRKLLVNEVSLAHVTDEYITFVRSSPNFPVEDAANFISVAATLLLIKSRSLLPSLDLSEEEVGDVRDLTHRLELYEKAREASRVLSKLFGVYTMESAGNRIIEPAFSPSADLSIDAVSTACTMMLTAQEMIEKLPEVHVRPMVSIEEMMDTLHARVQRAITISFKSFTGDSMEKVEIIVSFLALLELVKQGSVEALQHNEFADIQITNKDAGVPRY